MITNKEAAKRLAKAIENQKTSYPVIVDGNMHRSLPPIRTPKELITVEKCKKIIANIQDKFNVNIEKIEVFMDEWDYENITLGTYIGALYNDNDIPRKLNKKAIYNADRNCLQIWQDDEPIYENDNGTITRDRVALADCLL